MTMANGESSLRPEVIMDIVSRTTISIMRLRRGLKSAGFEAVRSAKHGYIFRNPDNDRVGEIQHGGHSRKRTVNKKTILSLMGNLGVSQELLEWTREVSIIEAKPKRQKQRHVNGVDGEMPVINYRLTLAERLAYCSDTGPLRVSMGEAMPQLRFIMEERMQVQAFREDFIEAITEMQKTGMKKEFLFLFRGSRFMFELDGLMHDRLNNTERWLKKQLR